jgi:hypothetical protein
MKSIGPKASLLILMLGLLVQSIIFNRYQTYAVNIHFAWILFFALIAYMSSRQLPLIGLIFGYFLSILSNTSPLLTAIFGLLMGVVSVPISKSLVWTLVWVRVVFMAVFAVLIQLPSLFSQPSLDKFYVYILFVFVNTIAALMIFMMTQPGRSYE